MDSEYKLLKEEILASMEMVKNYRNWTYTIVIALLAFSFDKGSSWLFLLPFVAIIPLYNLAMHQIDSTLRIGAYIYVFLEPGLDIKWETRLYKYDRMYQNQYSTKKSSIDPYIVLSAVSILLSFTSLDFENIGKPEVWGCLVTQVILALYCFCLFMEKHVDYIETKDKYIKEWRKIQQAEEKANYARMQC